ncbi:MAG TPA: HAD family phosphatase [Arachnia sp.]|nr:HAD family phosphatase [Arachnia sp.]HMT87410.1 HAD family phosphatase [Arachnia sp.]
MDTTHPLPPLSRCAIEPRDLEPDPRYRALIFDWDGTLANSHTANYEAFAQIMRARGVEIGRAWFNQRTGLSTADMAVAAVEPYGLILGVLDLDQIKRERDRAYLERLATVEPITETVDVLLRHRRRVKTAIASGGQAGTLLPTARAIGLDTFVDRIVTLDDTGVGKPAPDIFLTAARLLGVEPRDCLVYEDSDEGLAAADAAGMDSIDIRGITASR